MKRLIAAAATVALLVAACGPGRVSGPTLETSTTTTAPDRTTPVPATTFGEIPGVEAETTTTTVTTTTTTIALPDLDDELADFDELGGLLDELDDLLADL